MRLKRKLFIIGSALVLFIAAGGFILLQLNQTDEGASVTLKKPPVSETEQRERVKTEEQVPREESSEEKATVEDSQRSMEEPIVAGETQTTTEDVQPPSTPVSETAADTAPAPSEHKESGGLYFATREEAIAFGFSRFTQEEIDIFNRAYAKGLTPEQEEMAIQMAYSRFTAEEIAAIEEALNR